MNIARNRLSRQKNDENDAESVDEKVAGDGSYDASLDAYVFYARRRYETGDQIMLCYGKHTNLSLLEHYGFLLPPGSTNPNDAAPLLLNECRKNRRVSADARGRLTWTSLADLRADAADADADVRRLGLAKRARDVCRRGGAVSPAVERRVFEAVRDAAGRTLLSLATTAAQDEEAVAAARDEERKSAALESTDDSGAEARMERDAALDEHGAPREWTRGDDDDDDDDDDEDDDASDFRVDESNAWLAARWRLAYKRAVQAAYRLAQARVDEAVEAMGAAGTGDARVSSRAARVAKPRLGAR